MNRPDIDGALSRARGFVLEYGHALDRARLAAGIGDAKRDVLLAEIRAGERADGSFEIVGRTGLSGALLALACLDEVRAFDAPEGARVVAAIEGAQHEDGSWGSDPDSAESTRIVVTGVVAGLLAKAACARPKPLRLAGRFLAKHWGPERVQSGDYGSIAAFACFFANAGMELADVGLQWCGRELERGYRTGRLTPLQTARVLMLCDAYSLPGARLPIEDVIGSLLAGQAEDGGWFAMACDRESRVNATIEAAIAMQRFGRRG
jgi:hypothetical protein